MLTYLKLSENYLEVDLEVQTVLRIRLDGDITTTVSENKIEYIGTGIRITMNTTPLEWRFEIRTDNMVFNVSYADFPEMPEMLAEIMVNYMANH